MAAEEADDLLGLARPQQAGIDKDAGQLVADRLVQQRRRDRGIDAAGQAAHDVTPSDLAADLVDRLAAEQRHRPVAAAARYVVREVAQQLTALRRVDDLGMEQHAVKPALVIGNGGVGRRLARRDGAEPGRQCVDPVAMAHPHLLAPAFWPQPLEQPALAEDVDKRAAEFLMIAQCDTAAELRAHRLHAVADPEHRHAEPKDDLGGARRGGLGQRCRAARQDDPARGKIANPIFGDREGMDFAVDTALAHAARDELRDLAAEIEDQDAVGHGLRSNIATKKPSVPCLAGVSRRYCSPPGEAPPIVSPQARATGNSEKSGSAARKASACASSSSRSNEQVA